MTDLHPAHNHASPMPAGHSHDPAQGGTRPDEPAPRSTQQSRLGMVLAFTLLFAGVEAVGGILSGSLALLADAGHMVTDASALGLTFLAVWLSGRRTSTNRTYGFRRAELLAAFVNALTLVALAIWIVIVAMERLNAPVPIREGLMFWVALVGLLVNAGGIVALYGVAHGNLNIRAALWHVAGDLFGSIATILAAGAIALAGWMWVDPALSVVIALSIGVGGGKILLDSANLLLDSVPRQIDSAAVRRALAAVPEVRQICDLHIWGVSSAETMLTAHLVVDPAADRDRLLHRILNLLDSQFQLAHMTVQLESTPQDSCRAEW